MTVATELKLLPELLAATGCWLERPLPLAELETPTPVVDLQVLAGNLARMARYCQSHGLRWRPHCKTHKSPVIASVQLAGGAAGLTVATPREAEVMAPVTADLLLAYPPVGRAKAQRLLQIQPWPTRVAVALDSAEALTVLATAARVAGREVGVLIELDLGMRRVGLQRSEETVTLARAATTTDGVRYDGILFYPGHLREPAEVNGEAFTACLTGLAAHRAALTKAGFEPGIVSGGSTATLWRSHEFGVTEIRTGTTVYNDRTTAAIGVCEWSDCAYSVLSTVVSTSVAGQAVVDAGSKALSKEELRASGGGYGALLDRPEVPVRALSEEHGILDLGNTTWRPRVGDQVRIVPNHVCVSVNLNERVWGVLNGEARASWPVERGRGHPNSGS